jgi:hemerythrin superfamily protein
MDALDLLIADHNRVKGLFARYQEANKGTRASEAAELASTIHTELTVHTAIEEEIFYPEIHDLSPELVGTVDEGVQEHHVVKVLLGEIDDLKAGSDEWVAKMTVVIENVEHHVEEEESEMFPAVRSHSDAATRESLGEKLEARKSELGASSLREKRELPLGTLKELAKGQRIPGRSSMDHDELAATVGLE